MIKGDIKNFKDIINLSKLGINFTAKPIIFGGAAMDYYGLRKMGNDVDFIVSNDDYQSLVNIYPKNKKDIWGDLGIFTEQYEFFRSVYRLDYDFFSEGSFEYDKFKVISFKKLFLLKTLSFRDQPQTEKLANDFHLMVNYCLDTFRNKDYAANADKHIGSYLSAVNGLIYNDNY